MSRSSAVGIWFSPLKHFVNWNRKVAPSAGVSNQGKNARGVTFESKEEQKVAHDLFLLTTKPVLYVANVDEASAKALSNLLESISTTIRSSVAQPFLAMVLNLSSLMKIESSPLSSTPYHQLKYLLWSVVVGVTLSLTSCMKWAPWRFPLPSCYTRCRSWQKPRQHWPRRAQAW